MDSDVSDLIYFVV